MIVSDSVVSSETLLFSKLLPPLATDLVFGGKSAGNSSSARKTLVFEELKALIALINLSSSEEFSSANNFGKSGRGV
jgi:hypothetical protein